MKRHEQWFNEAWVEKVPAPLVLSDKEVLEWLNEYCDEVRQSEHGGWLVSSYEYPCVYGGTIRDAVCLAAAYHKEINEG